MMSLDVMYHQYSAPTYISSTPQSTTYDQIYNKMQDSTSALSHFAGGFEDRSKAATGIPGFGAFSLPNSNPFGMNQVGSQFQFPFRSSFHSPTDFKTSSNGNLTVRKNKMDDKTGLFAPGVFAIPRAKQASSTTPRSECPENDIEDSNKIGHEPPQKLARPSCARLDLAQQKSHEPAHQNQLPSLIYAASCSRTPIITKPHCRKPNEHRVPISAHGGETERKESATHYVNSRCVMYDYFEGDISQEVDEHFSRALSQNSKSKDLPSPMNQRNFPASFWNSEYKAPVIQRNNYAGISYDVMKGLPSSFTSLYGPTASSLHGRPDISPLDPFSATNNLTTLHGRLNSVTSDPWRVYASGLSPFSTQSSYSQQALNAAAAVAASDLYGLTATASHTLDPRFGSLFAQSNSAAVELARLRAGSSVASLAAGLTSPGTELGKEAMGLWNSARCPAFRF